MDEEERNYCCLVVLLTRVGVNRLRQHFIDSWDAVGTSRPWQDLPHNGKDLLTKFKPLPYEKSKVKSGDTTQWDLSLFVKALLRSRPPFVSDKKFVKSLNCLSETRNTVSHTPNGKITTVKFKTLWSGVCNALMVLGATSADFKKVKQDVKLPWNELTSLMKQCANQDDEILRGVQTIQARMEKLEVGQQEIKEGQQEIKEGQKEIKEVLQEVRVEMKEGQQEMKEGQQEIKEGQKEMKEGQQEIKEVLQEVRVEMKEGQQEIKEGQQEIKEEIKSGKVWLEDQMNEVKHALHTPGSSNQKLSTEEIKQRSEYLKASTKRQTEYQPKIMASHCIANARTDDIFTNLLMQHGRKSLPKGANRWEDLSEYSEPSGKPVERCQDIFIAQKKESISRNILVTGKAGIGKSVFCQKLVRDWADGVLFQEESDNEAYGFDFVYLLAFRHLNNVNKDVTLQEIMNQCSLLDEHSIVDEPLFKCLVNHQERVLFIIDGYDEYAQRERITSNHLESKYPNNPHSAMPVSALVSKLLKRKIFGEAVVMVTSRPHESNELGRMNFDTLVEIVGFSKEQVKEFILKYFKSNDEVRNDVLKNVLENEDLLSLAHVPMFCFLICWCMEWHLESKSDLDLPITMTELYSEFVDIFESKHHSKSKYRYEQFPEEFQRPDVVKTTLKKLSKLAVETMERKRFTFQERDLAEFGLNGEEIADLKASSLLTSGPGIRISPTKIIHYYCFSHLTLHDYFTAFWYIENNQVPLPYMIDNDMVFRFYAGICRQKKCDDLMKALFEAFSKSHRIGFFAKLLYEYGDKEFGAAMIHCYPEIFDVEKVVINGERYWAHFLDLLSYSSEKKSREHEDVSGDYFVISKLEATFLTKIDDIVNALKNPFCPITSFLCSDFYMLNFDPYCLESLSSTNVTNLEIVALGPEVICLSTLRSILLDPKCKFKTLTFRYCGYNIMTDFHFKQFVEEVQMAKPGIKIHVYQNSYFDPRP